MKRILGLLACLSLVFVCGCSQKGSEVWLETEYGVDFSFVKNGPKVTDCGVTVDTHIYKDSEGRRCMVSREPYVEGSEFYLCNYTSAYFDDELSEVATEKVNEIFCWLSGKESNFSVVVDTSDGMGYISNAEYVKNNDRSGYTRVAMNSKINIYCPEDLSDLDKKTIINTYLGLAYSDFGDFCLPNSYAKCTVYKTSDGKPSNKCKEIFSFIWNPINDGIGDNLICEGLEYEVVEDANDWYSSIR